MNDLEVRIVDREGNVDIFTDVTHMKVGKNRIKIHRDDDEPFTFSPETMAQITIKKIC